MAGTLAEASPIGYLGFALDRPFVGKVRTGHSPLLSAPRIQRGVETILAKHGNDPGVLVDRFVFCYWRDLPCIAMVFANAMVTAIGIPANAEQGHDGCSGFLLTGSISEDGELLISTANWLLKTDPDDARETIIHCIEGMEKSIMERNEGEDSEGVPPAVQMAARLGFLGN